MTGTPRLAADHVTLGYGDRVIVDELSLDVSPGVITTIIGPNGCGKSTLLRSLGRLLRPHAGQVVLDGKAIAGMKTKTVAQVIGMLPQTPVAPEGLTVADLVARGRHPHQSWLNQWSGDDETEVAAALAHTGIADLADRTLDELSGGQRQRAWISMALAQGTDILLLDEPTTYLDLAHSIDVLDLVDRLHADHGRTVVMVLHDLNLAIRYSDELIVLSAGRIVAQGRPADIVDAELLREVFGLEASVLTDPVSGRPMIVPIGTRHVRGAAGYDPGTTDRETGTVGQEAGIGTTLQQAAAELGEAGRPTHAQTPSNPAPGPAGTSGRITREPGYDEGHTS